MSDVLMVGCDLHDKALMLKSCVGKDGVRWRPGRSRMIVGVERFSCVLVARETERCRSGDRESVEVGGVDGVCEVGFLRHGQKV